MTYDYKTVIVDAKKVLVDNTEWQDRYDGYADLIIENESFRKSSRKLFQSKFSLKFYISVSQAKESKNTLTLDVRYMGQNIAELKAKKGDSVTISSKKYNDKNKRDFGCDIKLDKVAWTSNDASRFRSHFKAGPPRSDKGKGNEEHNVESLLLAEFSKTSRSDKRLTEIQPVCLAGIRFSMPTPLSASNHDKLEYSGPSGGGIDILARSGKGRGTYLTVIEVKDENVEKEPPRDALKQAIKYAVFLRELLRSESDKKWWRLFGFNGPLPKKLTIRCVCAMPDSNPDKSFEKTIYNVGDKTHPDEIECHYIYFKMIDGEIESIDSSLNNKRNSPGGVTLDE